MLREGGIPLDDEGDEDYVPHPNDRITQPRLPRYQLNQGVEN